MNILLVNSSPRFGESTSRKLSQTIVDRLKNLHPEATVVSRDVVAEPLPFVSHEMITAYYTPPADLTEPQQAAVALSNEITKEIIAADVIVVGVPMYNFGVPASLKAWFDLVARVGLTFKYTDQGPVGLLGGKKVFFAIATGGTPIGSAWDHTSTHLTTFFNFLGITDQEIIAADEIMGKGGAEKIASANAEAEAVKA